ncbi:MotA/TolQ/ExbB proton channel family protein [Planctomicrobium sp. SH668]|uniref:MotA/TolQ/ExbB proton channel family protein n=1 Tax=Planctomicrobium sp. SH668 TaxID=3448126 RepID=UPI003F5B3464
MDELIHLAEPVVYGGQILAAIFGTYCAIVIYRKINQKRFSSRKQEEAFLNEIRSLLARQHFDGVADLCDSPPYWSKATAQLILVALAYRDRGIAKLRILLGEKYEREVLADLDYRGAWIATIVKVAPMMGLLGTSAGMIRAFAELGSAKGGVDPLHLASTISIALYSTALGLAIAIAMTVVSSAVHVKKGKLTDSVQEHLGEFLLDLEQAMKR